MRKIVIEVPDYCNDCINFIPSMPIGETGDYTDCESLLCIEIKRLK